MTPFRDLAEALTWVQERWDGDRPIPTKLHTAGAEGGEHVELALGGPPYSRDFGIYLEARPHDTVDVLETADCRHPSQPERPRDCPDCWGAGVIEVLRCRFRYPMWRAYELLREAKAPAGEVRHIDAIFTLAAFRWQVAPALAVLGIDEAALLRALTALWRHYLEYKMVHRPVGWTEKSEAQRKAEEAA